MTKSINYIDYNFKKIYNREIKNGIREDTKAILGRNIDSCLNIVDTYGAKTNNTFSKVTFVNRVEKKNSDLKEIVTNNDYYTDQNKTIIILKKLSKLLEVIKWW